DKNMEELEDIGLKSIQGNRVADAGLSGLKKEWIEQVTRHFYFNYATPPKEAINTTRKKYGLGEPAQPTGDDDRGAAAPYLTVGDAGLMRVEGDAGARP